MLRPARFRETVLSAAGAAAGGYPGSVVLVTGSGGGGDDGGTGTGGEVSGGLVSARPTLRHSVYRSPGTSLTSPAAPPATCS
jgi:hypothetical protein